MYWINTNNMQTIKTSENYCNSGINMHLYFTIKSSFLLDLLWLSKTILILRLKKHTKTIKSICKRYTMKQDKISCQFDLTCQAPSSKCPCVRYVCLNLWIISYQRGKQNKLITFNLGSIACSLFWVSEFQRSCHYFSAWVHMSEWGTVKLDTGRNRMLSNNSLSSPWLRSIYSTSSGKKSIIMARPLKDVNARAVINSISWRILDLQMIFSPVAHCVLRSLNLEKEHKEKEKEKEKLEAASSFNPGAPSTPETENG